MKLFFVGLFVSMVILIQAQIQPTPPDPGWTFNEDQSDEFNNNSLDTEIWRDGDPDWRSMFYDHYWRESVNSLICTDFDLKAFRSFNNLTFHNNEFARVTTSYHAPPGLSSSTTHSGCCCTICNGNEWCGSNGECPTCRNWTKSYNYSTSPWLLGHHAIKYGYFEARLRCTNIVSPNNHKGFGANFWLTGSGVDVNFNNDGSTTPFVPAYSEIDVLEFVSWDQSYTQTVNHMYTLNSHYDVNADDVNPPTNSDGTQWQGSVSFANNTFHTFGVEWTPTYIRYYFDNNIVYTSVNNPSNMKPQRPVLDINAFTTNDTTRQPSNPIGANNIPRINVPYLFDIDFMRIYSLNRDRVLNTISTCNFNGLENSLYKSVTFQNCNTVLGINRVIRATDFIDILGSFDTNGFQLVLETMPDHVQSIIPINE